MVYLALQTVVFGLGCDSEPLPPGPKAIFVPRDFPTPQTAIDAARFGQTVFVEPGVYLSTELRQTDPIEFPRGTRAALFMKRGVQVVGLGGPGSVVFRDTTVGELNYGAVLVFQPRETLIQNLTFEDFHIGVLVFGEAGQVRNCQIKGGDAGIWVFRAKDPLIEGNVVEDAAVDGILNQFADGEYLTNLVRGCIAGIGLEFDGRPRVEGNLLCNNQMGIIANIGPRPIIRHNSILSNQRAGLFIGDGSIPIIEENDILGNGIGVEVGYYRTPLEMPVAASRNYWGTDSIEEIGLTHIRDQLDDPSLGARVEFLPIHISPRTNMSTDPCGGSGSEMGGGP